MYNQNSNYRCEIKTLDITLKSGETLSEKEIKLDKGIGIVVAAKPVTDLNGVINLGFFENSQEINTPIHVDFYRDREIGNHPTDGFMPLNTLGGANIEVRLSSSTGPVASDVTVQVVFIVKVPFIECPI